MTSSPLFEDADLISIYTRAQAIADGELIDTDNLEDGIAAQAGFRVPVAITRAAWQDCVAWDPERNTDVHQDLKGRLWDVLWMARHAARKATSTRTVFSLVRIPVGGRHPEIVELAMHIGPGDHAEPVITIMTTTED